jgi:hypothetical protein
VLGSPITTTLPLVRIITDFKCTSAVGVVFQFCFGALALLALRLRSIVGAFEIYHMPPGHTKLEADF